MTASDLHIKLTLMLLFSNIVLTLAAPSMILTGNYFYDYHSSSNQYTLASNITSTVADSGQNKDSLISNVGFVDVLLVVWGFISLIISLFFASLIVALQLPGVISLIVGIPLVLLYGFAIIGWIRG